MTTSLQPALVLDEEVVPEETLWFFRRHLQNAVYDFLIRTFRRLEDAHGLTKKALSERIDRDAGHVNRWLSAPSNLTLDSISDLFVGMAVDPTTLLVDELAVEMPSTGIPSVARLESVQGQSSQDEEGRSVPQAPDVHPFPEQPGRLDKAAILRMARKRRAAA